MQNITRHTVSFHDNNIISIHIHTQARIHFTGSGGTCSHSVGWEAVHQNKSAGTGRGGERKPTCSVVLIKKKKKMFDGYLCQSCDLVGKSSSHANAARRSNTSAGDHAYTTHTVPVCLLHVLWESAARM